MNLNKSFKDRLFLWMTLLSAIAPAFLTPEPVGAIEVPIDFCVVSDTWTRPPPEEQVEFISSNPRYTFRSNEAILQTNEWANNFLIYRQYYGFSGAEDLFRLSGFWSRRNHVFEYGLNELSECNSKFVDPRRQLTQIWAFSHQVQKVEWTGDRYIITVRQTGQGIQIFQFRKQHNLEELLVIEIVDEAGSTICLGRGEPNRSSEIICR